MMFGGENDFDGDERSLSLLAELAVLLIVALVGTVGFALAVFWIVPN